MVGAGLALLLAPQSGQETRRRIKELAEDASDKTSDYYVHTKDKIRSSIEKGKDLLEGKKSAVAAAVEAGKEAYEREVHK